ncbi:MAG: DUF4292 domain-containing protein [Saprospiraceae bacterium]
MKKYIVYLFLLLSVISCKTAQKNNKSGNYSGLDDKAIIQNIEKNNLDFEYANIKAEAETEFNGMDLNLDTEIRMKSNEYIWAVAKKFGIEGARILMRPDSVFVLDRINGAYYSYDLNEVLQGYGIELNFVEFQNFLIGNNITDNVKIDKITIDDNILKVNADNHKYIIDYDINDQLFVIFAKYSNSENSAISQKNDDFQLVNEKWLPFKRNIEFSDTTVGTQKLNLVIKSVEIDNKKAIKFDIPDHYVKKQD